MQHKQGIKTSGKKPVMMIFVLLTVYIQWQIIALQQARSSEFSEGRGKMVANCIQPFSNPQLNSLLQANLSAKGLLYWKLEYNPEGIIGTPSSLILMNDAQAILDYNYVFFAVDMLNKKVLGFRAKSLNTFIAIRNSQEIFFYPVHRLYQLNFNSFMDESDDSYFTPGLGQYSRLAVLIPYIDYFIAGIQKLGNPWNQQPSFLLLKKKYMEIDTIWELDRPGSVVLPPVSMDGKSVIAQEGLISIVNSDGQIQNEVKVDFIPLCCSIGIDNLIYMVCRTGLKYMVKVMDFDGNMRWETETSITQPNQPPIISRESTVFIVGNSKVDAMSNGQKLWEFQLTGSDSSAQLASVSQDSMLLVSDGNRIICLNKTGELVWKFSIAKGGVFKTQPVLDSVGKVFVATDKSIFALK